MGTLSPRGRHSEVASTTTNDEDNADWPAGGQRPGIPQEEGANEETANEETANEETANEEAANEEEGAAIENEETANEETANEEMANEEAANEEEGAAIENGGATSEEKGGGNGSSFTEAGADLAGGVELDFPCRGLQSNVAGGEGYSYLGCYTHCVQHNPVKKKQERAKCCPLPHTGF
ncbi:hypothetical protein NDU88_005144 [Pleurodeles waltl]|uniref:Uncharacterized protein n=1 Tax=Pleurodeles waltl TaxID=8319 RepID=A0AAV7V3H4_PLEWA|nr:hypothetical protein NDU88_005144 [Pleurodeles waltl]